MKMNSTFLLLLTLFQASRLSDALKCYECHDLRASSDDPGLSAIFDEKAAGNTRGCPPDKSPGGVTCSANINQCVADNVTMVIETVSGDGLTTETGTINSFATRDCYPVPNKEYPTDCYEASNFTQVYEDYFLDLLGEDFTGQVTVRDLEGYTCLCKTGWCNDQLDGDGNAAAAVAGAFWMLLAATISVVMM